MTTSRAGLTPEQVAERRARLRKERRARKAEKAAERDKATAAEREKVAQIAAARIAEHLSGLRVAEVSPYSRTEVYCTDCDWVQSGPRGYHAIRASSIRRHLADHPGHTIEAKMRGIERFTLDPAAGPATPSPASGTAGSRPTAGGPAAQPRGVRS